MNGLSSGPIQAEQLSFLPTDPANLGQHPVIQSLTPAVEALFAELPEFASIPETDAPQQEAADFSSRQSRIRRQIQNVDTNLELVRSAVALFLKQPEETDEDAFCRSLLEDYVERRIINYSGMDRFVASQIRDTTTMIGRFNVAAAPLPRLTTAMGTDSQLAFTMLTMLSEPIVDGETTEVQNFNEALTTVIAFEHLTAQQPQEQPSLISSVLRSLEAAEFDNSLAKKVIIEVETDQSEAAEAKRQSLARMAGILVASGLSPEQAMTTITSPAGITHWPTRLSSLLLAERSRYADAVRLRLDQRREFLVERSLLLPSDPEIRFPAAAREIGQILKLFYKGQDLGGSMTRAEIVATEAKLRRGNRGFQGQANNNGYKNSGEHPFLRAEPRDLRFIDAQGQLQILAEGEVANCVQDYVKKHAGGDNVILKAINEFIETLQMLDLSKMVVKGLVPHEQNFRVNGTNIGSLWQIRPDKFHGLGNLGKHAKKLRVYCTLTDSVLGIYKLLDKDEVHPWKRGKSIAGSSRGAK